MRVRTSLAAIAVLLVLAPGLQAEDAGEDAAGGAPDAALLEDAASMDTRREDAHVEDATSEDAAVEDAVSADAGVEDAAVGCGEVTSTGECQGDLLRFCQNDHVVEIDCPGDPVAGGPGTTCGLVDCDDQPYPTCFGHWCVARLGAACGDLACDVNQGHGCLGGVCALSTACDSATYLPTCAGDVATYCSHTVNDRDCAEGGQPYTCVPSANAHTAACVGLEGGECGTFGDVDYLCASGLRCDQGVCTARPPDVDAGSGADASAHDRGGAGDDDDEGGCGCAAPGRASGAALLLGVGLGLRWRRRTRVG